MHSRGIRRGHDVILLCCCRLDHSCVGGIGVDRPRIAHVGIAVADLDAALAFYRDVLGLEPHPPEVADGATIVALPFGESEVELLAPHGAGKPDCASFWPSAVPASITSAIACPIWTRRSRRAGMPDIAWSTRFPAQGAAGRRIAFVHPKATAGILLELTD